MKKSRTAPRRPRNVAYRPGPLCFSTISRRVNNQSASTHTRATPSPQTLLKTKMLAKASPTRLNASSQRFTLIEPTSASRTHLETPFGLRVIAILSLALSPAGPFLDRAAEGMRRPCNHEDRGYRTTTPRHQPAVGFENGSSLHRTRLATQWLIF